MKLTHIAVIVLLLAGCAHDPMRYTPIVDDKGVDLAALDVDKLECQQYASTINAGENAATGAVGGAAVGAAGGAIVGSAYGDAGYGAGYGAAVGALTGLLTAGAESWHAQRAIVRRCLEGRGYRVLF